LICQDLCLMDDPLIDAQTHSTENKVPKKIRDLVQSHEFIIILFIRGKW
jgi:hypothetical protein